MTSHSVFSASGATRWANCAGSMALSKGLHSKSGAAALRGTAGHEVASECLENDLSPFDFISVMIKDDDGNLVEHEIDEDMQHQVYDYVEYVRGISGVRLVETRVYYASALGLTDEEAFGTGDAIIIDGTHVHIIDLKTGRGWVGAENNTQLSLYAIGVVDALEAIGEEVTDITLHIVQPAVHNVPATWTITRAELAAIAEEMKLAAQRAVEAVFAFTSVKDEVWEQTYLNPGDSQCQWCPAASFCPALKREVSEFCPAGVEEFEIMNILEDVTPADLNESMLKISLLETWIKAVQHETLRRLTRGDDGLDYKMVKGREGNRRWQDEEHTTVELREAGVPDEIIFKEPAVKTPPQIEKELKKAKLKVNIDKLITRSPARPTMAHKSDPRPAWTEAAGEDEFGVVDIA